MLLLLALSCADVPPAATPAATPAVTPVAAPAVTPGVALADKVNLGVAFDDSTLVPVDTLVSESDTWNGKEVVIDGVVKEVCQKKGCWHTIATSNPDVALMVKDKEYAVFLPKDAAGKRVHVKGTFAVTDMPEDEARHYAEDAGKDPSTIVGAQKSYGIDVAGVRFVEG